MDPSSAKSPAHTRYDALQRWDADIAVAYVARGREDSRLSPCTITLQRSYTRDLVLVAADLAVRCSDVLGGSLATLHNTGIRDAALSVAIDRYLSAAPGSRGLGGNMNTVVDRLLEGLVYRRDPQLHRGLVILTADLPVNTLADLDAEVSRVLGGTDLTDLGTWHGDLPTDVRSSVIEAVVVEWMRLRADAFGTAIGRDGAERQHARRRSTRRR